MLHPLSYRLGETLPSTLAHAHRTAGRSHPAHPPQPTRAHPSRLHHPLPPFDPLARVFSPPPSASAPWYAPPSPVDLQVICTVLATGASLFAFDFAACGHRCSRHTRIHTLTLALTHASTPTPTHTLILALTHALLLFPRAAFDSHALEHPRHKPKSSTLSLAFGLRAAAKVSIYLLVGTSGTTC